MGSTPDVSRFPDGIKLPAGAITTTRTMLLSDSGGSFTVSQATSYTISLPNIAAANAGVKYTFFVTAVAAQTVLITQITPAATLIGSVVLDASVIVATGSGINFVNGALLGDNIEVFSNGVSWCCRAVSSAAGGITIT